jgi:hypothetical protein
LLELNQQVGIGYADNTYRNLASLGTAYAFTLGFSKIEQLDEPLKPIERSTAA